MSATDPPAAPTQDAPNLSSWIGQGKEYKDVPDFMSQELCNRLVIPENEILALPSKTLPISQLLNTDFSLQTQSLNLTIPTSCFSDKEPNTALVSLLQRPLPSRQFVSQLRSISGQAFLDGKRSVKDWTQKDIYLPFSVLTWWDYMADAVAAKLAWLRAKDWMEKLKLKDKAIIKRVDDVLGKTPWHGSLPGFRSFVSASDMAPFLSREMLTTCQVYAMLLRLESRMEAELQDQIANIIIAPPMFADGLSGIPAYASRYPAGSTDVLQGTTLRLGNAPTRLWTVAYSDPAHFGALLIDNTHPSQLKVNWGDSLRRKTPSNLTKGIKIWAAHHFPDKRLKFEEDLECASQTDSYSCSVISVNTLKHHIFGDSTWSAGTRELLRIEEFLQIMEFSATLHNTLHSDIDVGMEEQMPDVVPTNLEEPVIDTSNNVDRPQKRKVAELKVNSGNPSGPPTKQRRTDFEAYPSPKKLSQSKVPGKTFLSAISRSGAAKRTILEAVHNGTFKLDKKKWEKFKQKCAVLDPAFQVNEDKVLEVRHSKCTSRLTMGQPYEIENFKKHVLKCTGKKCHQAASNTRTLDAIFAPRTKNESPKTLKLWPCPGLTAENSDPRISNYLTRTQVESAGGVSELIIAKEMYGVDKLSELTKPQREAVSLKQKQTHCWRLDTMHGRIFAIGEGACQENVSAPGNASSPDLTILEPCKHCQQLLSRRAFLTAINKDVPDEKNFVHVPHRFINTSVGQMMMKNRGLGDLLKESSDPNNTTGIFQRFARKFAEGKFDDKPVFLGLLSAMVDEQERHDRGRGTQNMKYAPAFDEWCHELQCIRPEAYRSFRQMFAGRTERSFLKMRSTKPTFSQGISQQTLERAEKYRDDYGYPKEGPFLDGVDDSNLLKTFRPYYDGEVKKWFVIGGIGEPMEVGDIALLQAQLADAKASKATKLRLWTLSIPLPRVPPLILAAMPIGSKNNAKELAQMEYKLLDLLINSPSNFNIISLGSDGTTVEREARRELERMGFATPVTYRIPHPEEKQPVIIHLLKIRNRIMVPIQDTKHTRKTIRNNLFAGPRSLILGGHLICYQQVREIAFDKDHSPLYERDVVKLDRQDDRAAARLFSASTLEYLVERNSENLGLISFLFVFGELVDAYQSRTISHQERVKQVFRAKFFKDIWKAFLNDAEYSLARHFISREADDIIDIVVNGLLGLIYIHRDHLDSRFPLLPWMSGTESNEHVFGFLRSIIPDFTMLDVLRLVPKLGVRLMAACKRKGKAADFRKTAVGYSHTYSEADDADLNFLASFPTDEEIALLVKTAYDEALMLWSLLGYYPSGEASNGNIQTNDEEILDVEEELTLTEEPAIPSDRQELQDALDEANIVQSEALPSDKTDTALDECGFAAASLNLNDLENIEQLPDGDPGALEEIRATLSQVLQAISAQGEAQSRMIQNLLASVTSSTSPESNEPPSTAALDNLSSVTETSLSPLVTTRLVNQSRESRESTRKAGGKGSKKSEDAVGDHEVAEQVVKEPSERQLLARKIREILDAESERGTSTGLNRRVRWEKSAAGSIPSSNPDTTGNTANAQAAARAGASAIITKRRKAFVNVQLGEDIATAKIDQLSKLTAGCYGIVVVDDQLMIAKVLTLYERGGGKTAKHGWVSESTSIGAVSYLPVQVWCQNRQRNFKALWGATSRLQLPRFAHLPSAAFLYYIPSAMVNLVNNGLYLDLAPNFYNDIFSRLARQKPPIVVAVKSLTAVKRKKKGGDDDEGI